MTVPGDRSPAYPNTPSMKELGYDFPTPAPHYFVIGPKGMDKAVVDKLSKVFVEAMNSPPLQEFAAKNGLVVEAVGPEECVKQIKDDWKMYTNVIKDFNLKVQK